MCIPLHPEIKASEWRIPLVYSAEFKNKHGQRLTKVSDYIEYFIRVGKCSWSDIFKLINVNTYDTEERRIFPLINLITSSLSLFIYFLLKTLSVIALRSIPNKINIYTK